MSAPWRAAAAALDVMIAPAFGAPGFHARRRTWPASDIPDDLSERTYVVTGANAGIGRATTEALTSLIEPLMIAFLGVVVGSMIMALYMPMFSVFDLIQ